MSPRIQRMISVCAVMLIIGCVTVGTHFDTANVAKIEKGVTTQAQVIDLLGLPLRVSDEFRNGQRSTTLTYEFVEGNRANRVIVTLDSAGVVSSVDAKLENAAKP